MEETQENMDRIQGSIETANSLALTEKAPHLDDKSKDILLNKDLLAIILRRMAKEYDGMTYQEVADCIEADSISSETHVTPGRTRQNRIEGINPELNELAGKLSMFDIFFKAANPKKSSENVTSYIFYDLEPHNKYDSEGHILDRGVYYIARMISSQIPAPTKSTVYSVSKVYSIWICRQNIPKEWQNTVSYYEMRNTWNSADGLPPEGDPDFMTLVIVRLGNPNAESKEEIVNILNALFNPRSERSYEVLSKHIDFSEALAKEVKEMDGLGASIYSDGRKEERAEIVHKLFSKGLTVEEISDYLEIDKDKVEEIINGRSNLVLA